MARHRVEKPLHGIIARGHLLHLLRLPSEACFLQSLAHRQRAGETSRVGDDNGQGQFAAEGIERLAAPQSDDDLRLARDMPAAGCRRGRKGFVCGVDVCRGDK